MAYKICPKCGNRNPEEAIYCNTCGEDIKDVNVMFDPEKPKNNKIKKIILVALSGIIAIVLIIILIICLTNPIPKFKKYIENDDKDNAIELYDDKIRNNDKYQDKLKKYFKEQLNDIENDFNKNNISYDEAKNKLNILQNFDEIKSEAKTLATKINTINDSRTAFESAKKFIENNDYINAIKELNNVSSEDKDNYDTAKDLLQENKDNYKKQILSEVEDSINANDFQKAIDKLTDAKNILNSDSDIQSKLTECKTKLQQKKDNDKQQSKENAKNNQLVSVENVSIAVQDDNVEYKILHPDFIQAIVKNNTDKTIKSFTIGFIGWDSNGYPVKIKSHLGITESYVFIGRAEDVNILGGATYGQSKGWKLDENHNISTIYGCVKEVNFYDGTTWTNPYYTYWVSDYSEKPLH